MDLMGVFFNLDRFKVHYHFQKLSFVLEKTLGKKQTLPKRRISTIQEFLEIFPEAKDIFIDGTERPLQRPKKDKQKQKNKYSGKKKAHTNKNIVISDEKNKAGYLSPTHDGKDHDYPILKEHITPEVIPKDVALWLDKGFIGIGKDYPDAVVVMPKKKPKGKELTEQEKHDNKIISGIRILSEHAIGGVKRMRILTDKFRNKTDEMSDKVMFLSCGLWNYQLEYC